MTSPAKKNIHVLLFLFLLVTIFQCGKSKQGGSPPPPPPPRLPVLTSVSPVEGIIGDAVTIQGSDLANADKVSFNGTASKIVQNNSTSVITVVPAGVSPGIVSVVVHTAAGASNGLSFEVFKTPEVTDDLPPVLKKTIPSSSYTDYPLLIYGDYLSGVLKVTFNDKEAVIFTNNRNVITTTIPKDLPAGAVTIKVLTEKGTSTITLQVSGPPPVAGAAVNFSIVTIPPPAYVPTISNNWSCGLFSKVDDSLFVDLNSDDGTQHYTIAGKLFYHYDEAKNYNDVNYIEFTDTLNNRTYAGMFSSKSANPCILTMVLISSTDKTISTCTFDRRSNDENLVCDQ
ncbi:MAG TPA: IPT/TIG domain-containing protein [Puia sp.]|jgi:hypothetical protein|nr:IPT/TIG domain-containing protein [Puia sp.]